VLRSLAVELTQVGKYTIVGKIGAGAMGEVFKAHDPVLGRDVAIKVVLGKLSDDEAARQRFQREARAAAQLNHPNIVTVFDFGDEKGVAYMAMELLEGRDLRELLAKDELASLDAQLAMMEQILDGLAFAHARGVVHRDLKPGNVRVLPNGQVKIMDFGLAHRMQDAKATGEALMGTPYYMAPEQVQGEGATARSDIFSLGAVFYEMLSGRRPFTGATVPAVLYAVIHREPEPLGKLLPELPTGIVAMVMRALSKQPQARHADAGEMLNALRVAWSGGALDEEEAAFASLDPTPARPLGPAPADADATPATVRAALQELEQYLLDRIPPLMVTDSLQALLALSHDEAAAQLWSWCDRLNEAQPERGASEALQHALRKLNVIGELELVDRQGLLAFLRAVGARLAQALPAGEGRDRFRRAIARLGEADMVVSEPAARASAPEARVAAPELPAGTPGLRRLWLLEQRLRSVQGSAADSLRQRVGSHAVAAAASAARDEKELDAHLRRLQDAGVAAGAEQVFRNLGQELGDWAVPADLAGDTTEMPPPTEVQAMQKIVALPEDPVEVARRFRHLVGAATEQFNDGNLGRAVQMFELAAALAAEKRIEPGFVGPIRRVGHEALDAARMKQFMERPERLPQLRQVLAFFADGLAPEALLDQLVAEERRERRRTLLDLLVVHGAAARALARARLEAAAEPGAGDFARRNWIYLLRHIARPEGEPDESEVDAVARCAGPGQPSFLVKEALGYLAQTQSPRAAVSLALLLGAYEAELARPELDDAAADEALAALDRIAAALARQGVPKYWRALVRHALSRRPELGETSERLVELGSQDLKASPDVVDTLATMLRQGLPRGGVLGRFVSRPNQDLPVLVAALAGTRTEEVRALLEEVARKLPEHEAGQAAARALEAQQAAATARAAAAGAGSGELDGFSLPALLHRLAESRATGTLKLLPREGAGTPARLGFAEGRLVSACWGHRDGTNALYQLFERPFPGEFAFDAEERAAEPASPLGELGKLVREGIRRHRALAATSALVPEDAPLEATGEPPATVADEPEYELVVALWQRAVSRVPARRMEAELSADAFRIMRPLALWLEQGSLRVATAADAAASPAAPPG
jgi:predicted Ser/Thr protein kinase